MDLQRFSPDMGFAKSGFFVGGDVHTSKDAIVKAGLDWSVEKRDVFVSNDPVGAAKGGNLCAERYTGIVRATDNKILGITGNAYHPVQNKEAFEFMDTLVESNKMEYHSAGSFNDGRRVWILGKIGEDSILPNDTVENYILLYSSHDGSSSLRATLTNVRLVCENAIAAAMDRGRKLLLIRHTKNIQKKLHDATEVFAQAHFDSQRFNAQAREMAQIQMTSDMMKDFTMKLVPDPPPNVSNTNAENTREKIVELFETGQGTDIPGVAGTGWAAFNAVTEYVNHYRGVRGKKDPSTKRLQSALFGPSSKMVEKGANLILAAA